MRWCSAKVNAGHSQHWCASRLGISPKSLRNWHCTYSQLLEYKSDALPMTDGPQSQLKKVETELLNFIFARREQGCAIKFSSVVMKASKLLPEFSVKTITAKDAAVRRFLKSHDLVYRIGTHVSQKSPKLAEDDAADFVKTICPFLYGPSRHPSFILNMDQTLVYYSMQEKKSLHKKGARTVNVRTSKNESERITVAMTISAAGDLLQPTIVFKGKLLFIIFVLLYVTLNISFIINYNTLFISGKPGARIEVCELPTLPNGSHYTVQNKAWMDETVMLD